MSSSPVQRTKQLKQLSVVDIMHADAAAADIDPVTAAYNARHSLSFPIHPQTPFGDWYDGAAQFAHNSGYHTVPQFVAAPYDMTHYTNPQHRASIAYSSNSSSSSPYHSASPVSSTPNSAESSWSMMPPYIALPGSAPNSFYYRTPAVQHTRQRTNQACEKCRDRKTKVSQLGLVIAQV